MTDLGRIRALVALPDKCIIIVPQIDKRIVVYLLTFFVAESSVSACVEPLDYVCAEVAVKIPSKISCPLEFVFLPDEFHSVLYEYV